MIELAPGHKHGLQIRNPVMVAGGAVGLGEIVPRGLDLTQVGAVVVGPLTATARAGQAPPRYAEGAGGVVIATGGQARGVQAAVRKFARHWPRLGAPVIGQVVAQTARDVRTCVRHLRDVDGLIGLEIVPQTGALDDAMQMLAAAGDELDLPLLVQVRLDTAAAWAGPLVEAGTDGLVVGQPAQGMLLHHDGARVRGAMMGPQGFAPMLEALAQVADQALGVGLVAAGGIHTADQMQAALAVGAQAVQVDSAIWVEPALPVWLVAAWRSSVAQN